MIEAITADSGQRTAGQQRRTVLDPIVSDAERRELLRAAATDDHVVIAPSHIARQAGQIVGYASLGSIAVVNVWLDSRRVTAFDSLRLLRASEEEARRLGLKQYLMPCAHTSPFYPHMERLGFKRLGFTSLNWKGL